MPSFIHLNAVFRMVGYQKAATENQRLKFGDHIKIPKIYHHPSDMKGHPFCGSTLPCRYGDNIITVVLNNHFIFILCIYICIISNV